MSQLTSSTSVDLLGGPRKHLSSILSAPISKSSSPGRTTSAGGNTFGISPSPSTLSASGVLRMSSSGSAGLPSSDKGDSNLSGGSSSGYGTTTEGSKEISTRMVTGDKITRFASPNRFDSLDAPHSFLDSRWNSKSRPFNSRVNTDRITGKAAPERSLSHDMMLVESSVPQSYHSSGSAVVPPQRVSATKSLPVRRTFRGYSHDNVLDMTANKKSDGSKCMNTYEVRLQQIMDQRAEEHQVSRRFLLNHQISSAGTDCVSKGLPGQDTKVFRSETTVSPLWKGISADVAFPSDAPESQPTSAPATILTQPLTVATTSPAVSNSPPLSLNSSASPPSNSSANNKQPRRDKLQKHQIDSTPLSLQVPVTVDTTGGSPPNQSPQSKPAVEPVKISPQRISSSGNKPEITMVDSKVRTRVYIQSDSSTQAKTLTYNGSTPSRTKQSKTAQLSTAVARGNGASNSTLTGGYETDEDPEMAKRLDQLASQLGLLGESDGVVLLPPDVEAVKEASVVEVPVTPKKSGALKSLQRRGSEQLSSQQPTSDASYTTSPEHAQRNPQTPISKRGRSSLLSSLLRRLSPRMKRRSKSTSPSRAAAWQVESEMASVSSTGESSDLQGQPVKSKQSAIARFFTRRRKEKTPSKSASIAEGPRGSVSSSDAYRYDVQSEASSTGGDLESTSGGHLANNNHVLDNNTSGSAMRSSDHALRFEHLKRISENRPLSNGSSPLPQDNGLPSRPHALTLDTDNTSTRPPTGLGSASCGSTPLRSSGGVVGLSLTTPTGDPDTPKYLNLALSAFGYGTYYGETGGHVPSTTGSTASSLGHEKRPKSSTSPSEMTHSPDKNLSSPPTTPLRSRENDIESPPTTPLRGNREAPASPTRILETSDGTEGVEQLGVQMRRRGSGARRLDGDDGDEGRPNNMMTMSVYHRQCSTKDEELIQMRRKRTRSSSDGKEAKARSSLIMLAVSQGSPRGKFPTTQMTSPTQQRTSMSAATTPGADTSTNRNFPALTHSPLEEVTSSQGSHTSTPDKPSKRASSPPPDVPVPASPCRPSPPASLPAPPQEQSPPEETSGGKDGFYFLSVTDTAEAELRVRIEKTELDLNKNQHLMSEEVCGHLRSAVGKATLLISDKLPQFRGLCNQNLANRGKTDVEFVTLVSDLEGFWDMVLIQVQDVNTMFDRIDTCRDNQWQMPDDPSPPAAKQFASGPPSAPRARRPTTTPKTPKDTAAAAARQEARKRIAAARREAMTKQKQNSSTENDIVIFA